MSSLGLLRMWCSCDRYIGWLKRCALSKRYPELSVINVVKSISLATGRIPDDLAEEVFGDSTGGDHLAYAGAPTTRPCALRTMPWQVVMPSGRGQARAALEGRQWKANKALALEVRKPALRQRLIVILQQVDPEWRVDACEFVMGLRGAVRDREYEKVWDWQADGRLDEGTDVINRHVFACACSLEEHSGSGVLMSAVTVIPPKFPAAAASSSSSNAARDDLSPPSSPSSVISSSSFVSYTSSLASNSSHPPPPYSPGRLHPPLACSQRLPFEYQEDIAYGLVKRWIAVRHRRGELAVIAHVRIFYSSLEPVTGCPIIHLRSPRAYEDHYMLAQHIVCRITLSPALGDSALFFVSHVV